MLLAPSAPPGKVVDEVAFVPPPAPAAADPNPWLPGRFSPLVDWVYFRESVLIHWNFEEGNPDVGFRTYFSVLG
jgi:hypothetical protein